MFEVAPSENPQKLIKIDILLSPVKPRKMSIITHLSEQKKLCKKYMHKFRKMAAYKAKQTRIGKTENRYFRKPTVGRFSVC
jgi:hypothetical protein